MLYIKRVICAMLAVALFMLSACSGTTPTGEASPTDGTVGDIFTTPTTEETQAPSSTEGKGEDEETLPTEFKAHVGSISHGFADRSLKNEHGRYHLYTGGELHIDYNITTSGTLCDTGIGIVLILDGHPQPYRTAENAEYRYMHTFYPVTGKVTVEMIFTPVTGKEGDTLAMSAYHILDPSYYPRENVIGMMQTNGSIYSRTQLVFQATPPESNAAPVEERIVSQTMEYQDLTSYDIRGWSAEKLRTASSFSFDTDHFSSSENIYGISSDQDLTVYTEVFGAPAAEWSLILFIDHQPVSILSENQLDFSVPNGKKAVIETVLELPDFDGESSFYAVLFPRNQYALYEADINVSMEITSTYYLTDAKNLTEMNEKYGRS